MEKPQILVYAEKSLNYSAFDVKWVPKSAKVVTLGSHPRGTGALQVRTRLIIALGKTRDYLNALIFILSQPILHNILYVLGR